jgi:hypothetical protein
MDCVPVYCQTDNRIERNRRAVQTDAQANDFHLQHVLLSRHFYVYYLFLVLKALQPRTYLLTEQIRSSNNASDLYSGGIRIKSWPKNRIFCDFLGPPLPLTECNFNMAQEIESADIRISEECSDGANSVSPGH